MAWLPNANQLPRLWHYAKKYRLYWLFGGIFTISNSLLAATIPRYVGSAVDHLTRQQDVRLHDGCVIVVLGLAAFVMLFLQRRLIIGASRKVEKDMHNDLFRKLQTLPPSYFDRMQTGDIMARMTNDMNEVRMLLGPGLMHPASAIATLFAVCFFMLKLSPSLTLYSLILPCFILLFTNRLSKLLHSLFLDVHVHYSVITSRIQEALAGIQVVRAYSCEKRETERLRKLSDDYLEKNLRYFKVMGTLNPVFGMGHTLGLLVVLWIGGGYCISHRISIGDFAQYLLYLKLLSGPMLATGWVLNVVQRGMTALGRLGELFDAQSDLPEPATPICPSEIRGEIVFRNLQFAYRDTPILRNINLCIPEKRSLGIVGPVGCGKSTLIKLICRQYPVKDGTLFVDGIDVNQIPLGLMRSNVGLVAQDAFLFSSSLTENISFGLADEDNERVEWAAGVSRIDKDVDEMPDRFDTMLGERGVTLSSGQRQRTAIARALAIRPAILLLDDCLSAIDTQTESEILARLKEVLKDCTAVIVAHRISAISHCDQIIYMEDGRIVEEGTHQELLDLGGRYAKVYEYQLLEEQIEKLE